MHLSADIPWVGGRYSFQAESKCIAQANQIGPYAKYEHDFKSLSVVILLVA